MKTICAASLLLVAAAALGQGDWEVPAGFVPSPTPITPAPSTTTGPITFSEVEFPLGTLVDGLVVSSIGGSPLTAPLSFAIPSGGSAISGGPQPQEWISPPGIEGPSQGTLTIDFGVDVTRVVFGFAQSCGATRGYASSATVSARTSVGTAVGSVTVPGQNFGFLFVENQVDFTPGSAFRSVDITWDASFCGRFFVDNLGFDGVLPAPTVPEAALVGLGLALLGLGFWTLTRRERRAF